MFQCEVVCFYFDSENIDRLVFLNIKLQLRVTGAKIKGEFPFLQPGPYCYYLLHTFTHPHNSRTTLSPSEELYIQL